MKKKIAFSTILATALLGSPAVILAAEQAPTPEVSKKTPAEVQPFDAEKELALAKKSGDHDRYAELAFGLAIERYFWGADLESAKHYMVLASDEGVRLADYYAFLLTDDKKYAIRAAQNGDRRAYCAAAIAIVETARAKKLPLSAKEYKTAYQWYAECAQSDSPHALDALCNLAVMYRLGEGVTPDYETAMLIYQRAADRGSARGLREMAIEHFNLARQAKTQEEREKEWRALCNDLAFAAYLRDPKALEVIAKGPVRKLEKAQPVWPEEKLLRAVELILEQKKMTPDALSLLQDAAKSGNAHANIILALSHAEDAQARVNYFREAAKQGSLYAKEQLVRADFQDCVPLQERTELLQELVAAKIVWAPYNLAVLYENNGNMQKAIELFREDAARGNAASRFHMFSLISLKKAPGDFALAKDYLLRACAANFGDAEIMMAYPEMQKHMGIDGSRFEGATLAMKGLLDDAKSPCYGIYMLTDYYTEGNSQDPVKAKRLCEYGIKQGCRYSYFQFGSLYERGFFGTPDPVKAKELFQQGAKLGDSECIKRLKEIDPGSSERSVK